MQNRTKQYDSKSQQQLSNLRMIQFTSRFGILDHIITGDAGGSINRTVRAVMNRLMLFDHVEI